MTTTLHSQLIETNERTLAQAQDEYRSIIQRHQAPEPSDSKAMAKLLKVLSLAPEDVRNDIIAVDKVERLTAGLRTAGQREIDAKAMADAGDTLDVARLAYDQAQTAYNLAQGRVLAASRAEANDEMEIANAKKATPRIYG
jgi:hypothetical protein